MKYLLVLLLFTACTVPKAEPKQEAAAEAQETSADTPADIRNNRLDDIGAGGVFDTNKMWGDKKPYRTLPDGRVLSYTNSYGVELVSLEEVLTDIEIANFGETNAQIDVPMDNLENYIWYYKNSQLLDKKFYNNTFCYLIDDYFYNFIRNYTFYNAHNIETWINMNSLIPIDIEYFLKEYPSLQTDAIKNSIKKYLNYVYKPMESGSVYGLPYYVEEGWEQEAGNWPILSNAERAGFYDRALALAGLINGLPLPNGQEKLWIEYTKEPAKFPKYSKWISRNLNRLNLEDQGLHILGDIDKANIQKNDADAFFWRSSVKGEEIEKSYRNLKKNLLLLYWVNKNNQ